MIEHNLVSASQLYTNLRLELCVIGCLPLISNLALFTRIIHIYANNFLILNCISVIALIVTEIDNNDKGSIHYC